MGDCLAPEGCIGFLGGVRDVDTYCTGEGLQEDEPRGRVADRSEVSLVRTNGFSEVLRLEESPRV